MKSIFSTDFAAMAATINEDEVRKTTNKDAIAAIQEAKMGYYAGLVFDMKDTPLKKGNLPKTIAAEFDAQLDAAGFVNEKGKRSAAGKRFRELSVGLLRRLRQKKVLANMPSQATPEYIREWLRDEDINSEANLKTFIQEGREDWLAGEYEAIVKNVAKITFGKDDNGNDVPTGISAGDYGEPDKLDESITMLKRRRNQLKAYQDAVTDAADGERAGFETIQAILNAA